MSRERTDPNPPLQNGRDHRGRFSKGNPGGPGNPFARRTAALRSALLHTVQDDDIRTIAAKLLSLARAGDLVAIRLLLQYTVGKPAEPADPDQLDLDELHLFVHQAQASASATAASTQVSAQTALPIIRALVPVLAEERLESVARALAAADEDAPENSVDLPAGVTPPAPEDPTASAVPALPIPTVEELLAFHHRLRSLDPATVNKPEQTANPGADHGQ